MKSIKSLKFSLLLFSYSFLLLFSCFGLFMMNETLIVELNLFDLSSSSFSFALIFDKISISFSVVVTLISGSVFMFAHKYMEEDPFSGRFIWILLSFVVSMNLLIFSGSILFFFFFL